MKKIVKAFAFLGIVAGVVGGIFAICRKKQVK